MNGSLSPFVPGFILLRPPTFQMILQPPEFLSEVQFSDLFRERLIRSFKSMPAECCESIMALFFCLYDCVGAGIPAYTGEWQFNTIQSVKNNTTACTLADAKWCPAYFHRDDRWTPVFGGLHFEADRELLQKITAEYTENGLYEGGQRSRFWGLCTHLLKEFKTTYPWKQTLPNCEVIFIGNGAFDGEEATTLLNDGCLPADFWDGCAI